MAAPPARGARGPAPARGPRPPRAGPRGRNPRAGAPRPRPLDTTLAWGDLVTVLCTELASERVPLGQVGCLGTALALAVVASAAAKGDYASRSRALPGLGRQRDMVKALGAAASTWVLVRGGWQARRVAGGLPRRRFDPSLPPPSPPSASPSRSPPTPSWPSTAP